MELQRVSFTLIARAQERRRGRRPNLGAIAPRFNTIFGRRLENRYHPPRHVSHFGLADVHAAYYRTEWWIPYDELEDAIAIAREVANGGLVDLLAEAIFATLLSDDDGLEVATENASIHRSDGSVISTEDAARIVSGRLQTRRGSTSPSAEDSAQEDSARQAQTPQEKNSETLIARVRRVKLSTPWIVAGALSMILLLTLFVGTTAKLLEALVSDEPGPISPPQVLIDCSTTTLPASLPASGDVSATAPVLGTAARRSNVTENYRRERDCPNCPVVTRWPRDR